MDRHRNDEKLHVSVFRMNSPSSPLNIYDLIILTLQVSINIDFDSNMLISAVVNIDVMKKKQHFTSLALALRLRFKDSIYWAM